MHLMLAQNVIRKDKAEALFRLGISEDSATLIATLSPAQIMKIASSPMLLCRFGTSPWSVQALERVGLQIHP